MGGSPVLTDSDALGAEQALSTLRADRVDDLVTRGALVVLSCTLSAHRARPARRSGTGSQLAETQGKHGGDGWTVECRTLHNN